MLDFLTSATILDVAEHVTAKKIGGPTKERTPLGQAIRLFRDGSVYPSLELIEKFGLEYPKATVSKQAIPLPEGSNPAAEQQFKNVFSFGPQESQGFGFDVIDTDKASIFNFGRRLLIISPVSKAQPKVDLFASTVYNEDGTPKASVIDQGAKTFGMDSMIPMVEEIYGVKFNRAAKAATADETAIAAIEDGVEFIDLVVTAHPTTGLPWALPNGKEVAYIPKQISRGKDKGTFSTVRRECPVFYALLPLSLIEEAKAPQTQPAVSEMVTSSDEADAVAMEIGATVEA
jgi:hypothetical protein